REVEDDVDPVERGPERVGAQVEGVQGEAGPAAEGGDVALLDGPRVIGDEGVQADDLVAVLQQPLAEVGADEPGGAGDQTLHGEPPSWSPRGGGGDGVNGFEGVW